MSEELNPTEQEMTVLKSARGRPHTPVLWGYKAGPFRLYYEMEAIQLLTIASNRLI